MALLKRDDVPLSNPSFFVKKMQEGIALGLLTRSNPWVLIFGGPSSYARPTEARRDLKYGTDHLEPRRCPSESPSLVLVINDTKLLMPYVKRFKLGISNTCDEGACGMEWWPQDHKEMVH
jgi:hypothetical protein